jgi:acetoacetyl-CoA synthetase
MTGKNLEVPVKRILTGMPAAEEGSEESLADPSSLNYFQELAHAYTH